MNSDNPKIQFLLTLGQPEDHQAWPDYLSQYGFTEQDIPALLTLYADEEIDAMEPDRVEVWAPVHAWRILGQLGNEAAIGPIINSFDSLYEDDYAQFELPTVIGMIGAVAIPALTHYWQQAGKDQFSYGMAIDALCEIAKRGPGCRQQVIAVYLNYMGKPDTSAYILNGILIVHLTDLKAVEVIDAIRQMFELGCVDISIPGDLEDVEIELGLRHKRSTPRPSYGHIQDIEKSFDLFVAAEDEEEEETQDQEDIDVFHIIDSYLLQYGRDESILDSSELDGYFAAIACAPKAIMPSSWIPLLWGGEQFAPEWEDIDEFNLFNRAIMSHYNNVVTELQCGHYIPLFLESTSQGTDIQIVDEWCEGFCKGLHLWGEMTPADMKRLEQWIYPMRHFATDDGLKARLSMSRTEIRQLQESILPNVENIYRHFFKPVKVANTTFVHAGPKIGRNEPCPCGSGKKYKKCCGLN